MENKDTIEKKIERALTAFYAQDQELLALNANERSISHRLAVHLQAEFGNRHVDCEYNRDGHDPKRLALHVSRVDTDDIEAQTVFPDIIIHKRNSEDNLVVIEIKKSSSTLSPDRDLEKLKEFVNQLGYQFALFIKLYTEPDRIGKYEIRWVT